MKRYLLTFEKYNFGYCLFSHKQYRYLEGKFRFLGIFNFLLAHQAHKSISFYSWQRHPTLLFTKFCHTKQTKKPLKVPLNLQTLQEFLCCKLKKNLWQLLYIFRVISNTERWRLYHGNVCRHSSKSQSKSMKMNANRKENLKRVVWILLSFL